MTFDLALMGHPKTAGVSTISAANYNYVATSLNKAVDGNGGGSYNLTSGLTFTGAGVQFNFTASPGLEINGAFGARVLSGSTLQVNSGGFLTLAATSTTTFTATSIVTGSAKITLTLENLSILTFANGANVLFNVGSATTMDGDVDLGGAMVVSSGGAIGVASGGEIFLDNGGLFTVQSGGDIVVESGGDVTVSSGATLAMAAGSTLTLGGTVTPTHSARTFTRTANPNAIFVPANYSDPVHQGPPVGFYSYTALSDGTDAWLMFAIDPPDGSTITECVIRIDPANGHAVVPTIPPELHLYVQNVTDGSAISDTSQTDTSANGAAFDAAHTITITGLGVVVDKSTKAYWLGFRGEGITNGIANCRVDIPKFTFTRTKLGEE